MNITNTSGITTDKLGDFIFVRHLGHRIGSITREMVPNLTGDTAYRPAWIAHSFDSGTKALINRYATEAEALTAVVNHWRAHRGVALW